MKVKIKDLDYKVTTISIDMQNSIYFILIKRIIQIQVYFIKSILEPTRVQSFIVTKENMYNKLVQLVDKVLFFYYYLIESIFNYEFKNL